MKPFDYLFITYIVTSKPKRISVAAGVVHMVLILKGFWLMPLSEIIHPAGYLEYKENHERGLCLSLSLKSL